jgi:REP element-mobilizing transposase RayT
MGGIAKQNKIIPLAVGGIMDHAHLLLSIPAAISVSKAVQLLKSGSTKWIHENFKDLGDFAWQTGYSAFSVSPGRIQRTMDYINNQEQHHLRVTFQEEYIRFLKESGIVYEEHYVWG